MLQEAHNRISSQPDKYVDHIYGEKEAGGTSVLYLSSVPFDKLGFPEVGNEALSSIFQNGPPRCSSCCYCRWRTARQHLRLPETKGSRLATRTCGPRSGDHGHHVEFEPLQDKLWTPFNWMLLVLMAFGADFADRAVRAGLGWQHPSF